MPVKTLNKEGQFFDDTNVGFCTAKREGMTITLPQKPVSILQNKQELMRKGFKRFLVDVSFCSPSQNTFKTLIKRYYKGEQLQPSTSFNFKKGLS
jgi:putative protease